MFSGTIDLNLIAEQWDGLVRVAAPCKNRIVSANVIVRRLASSASSNRLAKALPHLGQLVKTIYILRYFNDPMIRQQVRTQLNRGEARQGLAQRLFFADQGMFRSGDYYQMMNRASCLSLLSNAVLVYNTLRIGRVLEQAKAQGQEFTLEAIAHISPLARRHVIVNGTYDFSPLTLIMQRSNYAGNTLAFKSAWILCKRPMRCLASWKGRWKPMTSTTPPATRGKRQGGGKKALGRRARGRRKKREPGRGHYGKDRPAIIAWVVAGALSSSRRPAISP